MVRIHLGTVWRVLLLFNATTQYVRKMRYTNRAGQFVTQQSAATFSVIHDVYVKCGQVFVGRTNHEREKLFQFS